MANAVHSLRRVSDAGYAKTMSVAGKTPWYLWCALYATFTGLVGIVLMPVVPWFIAFGLPIPVGVLVFFCVKTGADSLLMAQKGRVPFYGCIGGVCVFGTWLVTEIQALVSVTRSTSLLLSVTLCGISLMGTILMATLAFKKLMD